MTAAVWTTQPRSTATADRLLKAAVGFWFVVAMTGQLVFAVAVGGFYGRAAGRGDWHAWNRIMPHGYLPGDGFGNAMVGMHLLSAVIIILGGVVQLVPRIRTRAPVFHRWNGRLYIVAAFAISVAGLYMMWVRGTVGDLSQHLGTSLMAVLIMLFAVMALRAARARDFKAHRIWALRLYLTVSASLFIRGGIILSAVIFHGAYGYDGATFTGPFLTFMSFAQYLLPLAVLELYLRARNTAVVSLRVATATLIFLLAILTGAGIAAITTATWLSDIELAYVNRNSIAEPLAATIAAAGIDAATKQYHDLKAANPDAYDFGEDDLDSLGYDLIHAKQFKDAIGIFQLNVEAYPQSSNTYDSLGEALMDDGDKPLAIANYQKSLELNPNNHNAVKMLLKLNAP